MDNVLSKLAGLFQPKEIVMKRGESFKEIPIERERPNPLAFLQNIFRNQGSNETIFRAPETPQPTMQPTPLPQVLGVSDTNSVAPRQLDLTAYQGQSTVPVGVPPEDISRLIWEYFPQEASAAATALWGENAGYDLNAINRNNDGTNDYGLWQLNDKTLNDMLSKNKYRSLLNEAGVSQPTDVLGDAERATRAASVARMYEQDANAAPWSWWYGWQNKGANINPEEYGNLEDLAGVRNPSGNQAYFQLAKFLQNR